MLIEPAKRIDSKQCSTIAGSGISTLKPEPASGCRPQGIASYYCIDRTQMQFRDSKTVPKVSKKEGSQIESVGRFIASVEEMGANQFQDRSYGQKWCKFDLIATNRF